MWRGELPLKGINVIGIMQTVALQSQGHCCCRHSHNHNHRHLKSTRSDGAQPAAPSRPSLGIGGAGERWATLGLSLEEQQSRKLTAAITNSRSLQQLRWLLTQPDVHLNAVHVSAVFTHTAKVLAPAATAADRQSADVEASGKHPLNAAPVNRRSGPSYRANDEPVDVRAFLAELLNSNLDSLLPATLRPASQPPPSALAGRADAPQAVLPPVGCSPRQTANILWACERLQVAVPPRQLDALLQVLLSHADGARRPQQHAWGAADSVTAQTVVMVMTSSLQLDRVALVRHAPSLLRLLWEHEAELTCAQVVKLAHVVTQMVSSTALGADLHSSANGADRHWAAKSAMNMQQFLVGSIARRLQHFDSSELLDVMVSVMGWSSTPAANLMADLGERLQAEADAVTGLGSSSSSSAHLCRSLTSFLLALGQSQASVPAGFLVVLMQTSLSQLHHFNGADVSTLLSALSGLVQRTPPGVWATTRTTNATLTTNTALARPAAHRAVRAVQASQGISAVDRLRLSKQPAATHDTSAAPSRAHHELPSSAAPSALPSERGLSRAAPTRAPAKRGPVDRSVGDLLQPLVAGLLQRLTALLPSAEPRVVATSLHSLAALRRDMRQHEINARQAVRRAVWPMASARGPSRLNFTTPPPPSLQRLALPIVHGLTPEQIDAVWQYLHAQGHHQKLHGVHVAMSLRALLKLGARSAEVDVGRLLDACGAGMASWQPREVASVVQSLAKWRRMRSEADEHARLAAAGMGGYQASSRLKVASGGTMRSTKGGNITLGKAPPPRLLAKAKSRVRGQASSSPSLSTEPLRMSSSASTLAASTPTAPQRPVTPFSLASIVPATTTSTTSPTTAEAPTAPQLTESSASSHAALVEPGVPSAQWWAQVDALVDRAGWLDQLSDQQLVTVVHGLSRLQRMQRAGGAEGRAAKQRLEHQPHLLSSGSRQRLICLAVARSRASAGVLAICGRDLAVPCEGWLPTLIRNAESRLHLYTLTQLAAMLDSFSLVTPQLPTSFLQAFRVAFGARHASVATAQANIATAKAFKDTEAYVRAAQAAEAAGEPLNMLHYVMLCRALMRLKVAVSPQWALELHKGSFPKLSQASLEQLGTLAQALARDGVPPPPLLWLETLCSCMSRQMMRASAARRHRAAAVAARSLRYHRHEVQQEERRRVVREAHYVKLLRKALVYWNYEPDREALGENSDGLLSQTQ